MQPSISVTLEPGLERGVPWGRDLYTFVTSAASHMMRTLQKPRKNRPSKRQVNHRRFLHNMIQRKFADIEAANHRLASALYFKEEEKNISSQESQKPETADQSGRLHQRGCLQDPDQCAHTGADDASESRSTQDVSGGPDEAKISGEKQADSEHLWKRQPESQPATCTTRKDNQTKGREKKDNRNHKLAEFNSMTSPKGIEHCHGADLFHNEYYGNESPLESSSNLSEDSQTTLQDSGFVQLGQDVDISPFFSPELSLLSLDSCDLSIQMFADVPACAQAQRSVTDISESQWTDIMDLFSAGSKDSGGCADVEASFESICLCQSQEQEIGAADAGFADQSDGFTEQAEDLQSETGECRYEYGYSCDRDQGLTSNRFQGQVQDATETQLNNFKTPRGSDTTHKELHTPVSYNYNTSEQQMHQRLQGMSPCMLVYCENNPNFTPFEGVAQSFSVPPHNPAQRPIPALPQEDDWLFTDILKDRKSPDC